MNNHLRKLIGRHRQDKGLNFGELPKLCGLKPKKWVIKINFEREGVETDELVSKVIQRVSGWR
ncbi:MAG: hypothetical protein M1511_15990 [Deltaproteobacteria bacterium]|nr:hypothetical protein [Deltaproteobacteria bacterium]